MHSFYLIDDSPVDLMIIEKLLKLGGLAGSIERFSSGRPALDHIAARSLQPNRTIILLDMMMPEMDGFEFLDAFGLLPAPVREQYTIFMLSSSLDPRDLERAEQNPHVRKFLNKPLNVEELQRSLV